MKINGPGGVGAVSPGVSGRPAAASGFRVSTAGQSATAATARAGAASGVGSIDALLALQEAEGPLERRRRAVKRGGRLLDMLDEVKLAMLGGESPQAALLRLATAVREERPEAGDARLEGVLDEIETRAAVEMAKAEMSRLAA
jgi:hypothetical protein